MGERVEAVWWELPLRPGEAWSLVTVGWGGADVGSVVREPDGRFRWEARFDVLTRLVPPPEGSRSLGAAAARGSRDTEGEAKCAVVDAFVRFGGCDLVSTERPKPKYPHGVGPRGGPCLWCGTEVFVGECAARAMADALRQWMELTGTCACGSLSHGVGCPVVAAWSLMPGGVPAVEAAGRSCACGHSVDVHDEEGCRVPGCRCSRSDGLPLLARRFVAPRDVETVWGTVVRRGGGFDHDGRAGRVFLRGEERKDGSPVPWPASCVDFDSVEKWVSMGFEVDDRPVV